MSGIDSYKFPFFAKIEGCGNKFAILNYSEGINYKKLSMALSDPNFGVGTDGLLVVHPCKGENYQIDMYNPDGSLMGMCGNGIRCVTRFIFLTERKSSSIINYTVENRTIVCSTEDEGRHVTVDMGEPSFNPKDIPLNSESEWIDKEVSGFCDIKLTALSMGNPHAVIFNKGLDEKIHSSLEYHELFPKRVNVELVDVISKSQINVKVWERGAGFTLACGTGACASVVAGAKLGILERDVSVRLPGGDVNVKWDQNNHVFLTGPANEIFTGFLSDAFLERIKND